MLRRTALLNVAGHAAPLLAALVAVPLLVQRLDADRFGFLSLAWVVVGYFGLFDLGLGRALTRLVAELGSGPRRDELPALSRTALSLTAALGALAALVVLLAAEPLCSRVLAVPPALQEEAVAGLRVLALCLPLVTLTAALRGLLEAVERFDWVNAIRIPLGVLTFVAPLAVAGPGGDLASLAAVLALVRVAGFAAHWFACRRLLPRLTGLGWPRFAAAREMVGYGAWLTISNVVGPLMVYLDRFALGSLVALSAVAYYTAPYEVVTRLWIIPAAVTGVLFPAFAAAGAADGLRALYLKGAGMVAATVLPLALLMGLAAPQWMDLWLGAEYAARGSAAARWLCVGVALNSLAYLPYTLLQARGRADLVAKVHLLELPLYLALLWLLTQRLGLEGAAIAWTLRCALDAVLLSALARPLLRPAESA